MRKTFLTCAAALAVAGLVAACSPRDSSGTASPPGGTTGSPTGAQSGTTPSPAMPPASAASN